MKKQIEQVKEFNKVFGIEQAEKPTLISYEDLSLRIDLMLEELEEYYQSWYNEDDMLIEVADALGDILYLVYGAVLQHGLQDKMEDIFTEIHNSNMSKSENGNVIRREDGKVMKGKNYFKPNIKAILNK